MYDAQLRKHWSFVLSVAISKPNVARTYFHLVFGTDNEVAVKIMKHVMHKAKDHGWRQLSLFEEQDFAAFKEWIHDRFRHQTVRGKEVMARALEQHPYQGEGG